jgi:hypothetical protein
MVMATVKEAANSSPQAPYYRQAERSPNPLLENILCGATALSCLSPQWKKVSGL